MINLVIKPLNHSLDNVLTSMLASKQKESTKATYKQNLKYFAFYLIRGEVKKGNKIYLTEAETQHILKDFLKLDRVSANTYFLEYRTNLIEAGYSPNSINIKLSAVKALVYYAFKLEICQFLLDIHKLPSETWRDTTGISKDKFSDILSDIDTDTISGKRDYAIMRLLWDNALRRSEISNLNVEDFSKANSTLNILSKGKLSKQVIYLASKTVEALFQWLEVYTSPCPQSPLFISLATNTNGNRLTGKSIYCIVRKYADKVLADKILSPHRVRHSSITAVLDASNGNVRLAQKHSRHKNLDVLTRYDDNRVALQKEAVNLLADMV